jgi:curved DNA-binding protein CbpA
MSSRITGNDNELEQDPYAVLGVLHTASDADINKAFKKLALKLHPDKLQQQQQEGKKSSSSSINREKAEEAFHQVQWAKSFLLDAEFAEQRRRFDAQRASRQARRVADDARSAGMSDKRRRMRDELQRQEQQASHHLKKRNESKSAAAAAAAAHGSSRSQAQEEEDGQKSAKERDRNRGQKNSTTTAEEAAKLERLRRQGNEMREAYADRQEEQTAAAAAKSRRERQQYDYVDDDDEQRQVRLKWSRKKLADSSSSGALTESTLMQILKQKGFGDIERIEMLGNKGNAALVTFVSADSCRPCVDALLDSEEMRATFVGRRKEREEEFDEARKKEEERLFSSLNRNAESVADWKLRRAAEREELLRQVERDEDTATAATKPPAASNNTNGSNSRGQKRKSNAVFPPPLPEYNSNTPDQKMEMSPFERLQRAEVEILEKTGILSKQKMRAFQEAKVVP